MAKIEDEKNGEPEQQEQTGDSGGTPDENGASLDSVPEDGEKNAPDKDSEDGGKRGRRGRKPAGVADGGEDPSPPEKKGNTRMKCAALRGLSVIVGKGEPVQIDKDGFFEVGEKEAARLLTIPGYEKA
jgi:hypothetical protein